MLRHFVLILLMLSSTLSFSPIFAQNLEASLSQETLFYLSVPTGKEFAHQYQNSALGKLCQEPEIKNLVAKFSKMAAPYIGQMNQPLQMTTGKTLSELLDTFEGEIALAILKFEGEIPEVAINLGFGSQEAGEALLQKLFQSSGMVPNKRTSDGFAHYSLNLGGPTLYYTWQESNLVLSLHLEVLRNIVAGTKQEKPLANVFAYKELSETIGDKKAFRLWANLGTFLKHPMIQATMPPEIRPIISALGIDQWTSLSAACWFQDLDLKTAFQIGTDGSTPKGLNTLLNPTALNPGILNRIPKSMTDVSAFKLDIEGAYKLTKSLILQMEPSIWDSIQPYLEMLEKDVGAKFEDVLPLSGSVFSSITFEDGLGSQSVWCLYPENALEWQVKMQRLFQSRMDVDQKKYKGKEIFHFRVPLGRIERGLANIMPLNIVQGIKELLALPTAFYVDGDRIVAAHLPQTLMNFIDELETPGNLPSQVSQALQSGVASISWSSVGKSTSGYYTICEVLSMFLPAIRIWTNTEITTFDLPRGETVIQYARPSFSYTKTGKTIFSVSQINVIPTSFPNVGALTVVATGGVVAAIAIPNLLRARVSSNETSAIGTLRSTCTAQNQFQNATIVDVDQDGVGEYGWFQELAGTGACRGSNTPISPPFIQKTLGESAQRNGGIAQKSGYYFVMYLPTDSGSAVRESAINSKTAANGKEADANHQETRWICYAWPVTTGSSGNRCFVINQAGEVYCSYDAGYNGLNHIPTANAALSNEEGSENLDPPMAEGTNSCDGNEWFPAY